MRKRRHLEENGSRLRSSRKETLELCTARKGGKCIVIFNSFNLRASTWITAQLMTLSTECAAALLSFRYPSLLRKDFLNALTASVLGFFYFNIVKFTYIDDMILIFLY